MLLARNDAAVSISGQAARAERFDDALKIVLVAREHFQHPIVAPGSDQGSNDSRRRGQAGLKLRGSCGRFHLHLDQSAKG